MPKARRVEMESGKAGKAGKEGKQRKGLKNAAAACRQWKTRPQQQTATVQLTNCRQVTQIIHDEDDDDERKVLARRWDAKWDARWYGLDWGTTSGPSALHKLFYSFPPIFFRNFYSWALLWQRPSKGRATLWRKVLSSRVPASFFASKSLLLTVKWA